MNRLPSKYLSVTISRVKHLFKKKLPPGGISTAEYEATLIYAKTLIPPGSDIAYFFNTFADDPNHYYIIFKYGGTVLTMVMAILLRKEVDFTLRGLRISKSLDPVIEIISMIREFSDKLFGDRYLLYPAIMFEVFKNRVPLD